MNREQQFAAVLAGLKSLAGEQEGFVTEEQVETALAEFSFDTRQIGMVYEYLKGQKIGIGEPLNPDEFLTDEEKNYLSLYLEELAMLDTVSDGVRKAVTLSAMAGDMTARQKLIEIYLPQVVDIARLYAGQGALLEDLIGEGNVALAMGVEMLGTTADVQEAEGLLASMIMEAMENYIADCTEEKDAGSKVLNRVNETAGQARELAESLGRKISLKELAEETGTTLEYILEAVKFSGENIEDIDLSGALEWATSVDEDEEHGRQ